MMPSEQRRNRPNKMLPDGVVCLHFNSVLLMSKPYDLLLVGAGLYSAIFAWHVTRHGRKCLVVEKRPHTGGNLHCQEMDGINVHVYGAHIFHTSDSTIWEFVNQLTPFNNFINSPLARSGGRLYNLPFNMNTFYQMWGCTSPAEAMRIINHQRAEASARQVAAGHDEPTNLEEQALRLVGHDIYATLIKGYTEKQWGRPCTQLPTFIIRRLPVRMTFDNNYFNDIYQGIPSGGYNRLIDKLFTGCEIITGCDYTRHRNELDALADTVVYTGAIDEYFGYRFGHLDYRAIRLETEIYPVTNMQGNAVINHCDNSVQFTRTIEHKHFATGTDIYSNPLTAVSREYSCEWEPGLERCYPVNDGHNTSLHQKYDTLAKAQPNTIFGGRLAEYRYNDMDDTIRNATQAAQQYLCGLHS